jgi:hypothetical protein
MIRWGDEQRAVLREFSAAGWTQGQIARAMSCSESTISKKMSELGIKPMPRGRQSYVLGGESKGGVVTVRLPKGLHREFAEMCLDRMETMNDCLVRLISGEVALFQGELVEPETLQGETLHGGE